MLESTKLMLVIKVGICKTHATEKLVLVIEVSHVRTSSMLVIDVSHIGI